MGDDTAPSKTQLKRKMLELQDLGAQLVTLNAEQLDAIELPDALRVAVLEARRITGFEARRRQLQYIGKLMRGLDATPIRAAVDAWRASSSSHTARLKRIERWRSRLIAEPNALGELLAEFPRADAQRLRTLIRNARLERGSSRPPRNFRALYQALRDLIEGVTNKGDD